MKIASWYQPPPSGFLQPGRGHSVIVASHHLCGNRPLYPILVLRVVFPPTLGGMLSRQVGDDWGQSCRSLGLSLMRPSDWETSPSAPGQGEFVEFEASVGVMG